MSFGLALIITAEVIAVLLLFYGFMHEDAVVRWEDKMLAAAKRRIKAYRHHHRKAVCRKVNTVAAYTPVVPKKPEHSGYGAA